MGCSIYETFCKRGNCVLGTSRHSLDTSADRGSHDRSGGCAVLCKPSEARKGTRWIRNNFWTGRPIDHSTCSRIEQLWTSPLDCLGRSLLCCLRTDTSRVLRTPTLGKSESSSFQSAPEGGGREFPRRNGKDKQGDRELERGLQGSREHQRDQANSAATATTSASPPPRRIAGVWSKAKPPTTTTRMTSSTRRSAMKFLST